MFLINPYILQESGNPLWDGLWNRALDSTEVTELYNSGSGLQYTL